MAQFAQHVTEFIDRINFIKHSNLTVGVKYLTLNRILMLAATSFIGLFLPIYLYGIFGDINLVLAYYGIGFFFQVFIEIIGAKIMNQIGLKKTMILSIVFYMLTYFTFYLFKTTCFFLYMFFPGINIDTKTIIFQK